MNHPSTPIILTPRWIQKLYMWWSIFQCIRWHLNWLIHRLVWATEAGQMRERNRFQNVPSTQYQKQMCSNCTWLATRQRLAARQGPSATDVPRDRRDADDEAKNFSENECSNSTTHIRRMNLTDRRAVLQSKFRAPVYDPGCSLLVCCLLLEHVFSMKFYCPQTSLNHCKAVCFLRRINVSFLTSHLAEFANSFGNDK